MGRGERVKLAAGDDPIAGYRWAVVQRPSAQVDPDVTVPGGPNAAEAFSDGRGGVPGTVAKAVSVGFGARSQIDEVDVDAFDGLELLEVLFDDAVDGGVGDWGEGGAERGRGGLDLGI